MSKIGDIYKFTTDEDGKVRMIEDHKKIRARKPASARYPSTKPKPVSRAKAQTVKSA